LRRRKKGRGRERRVAKAQRGGEEGPRRGVPWHGHPADDVPRARRPPYLLPAVLPVLRQAGRYFGRRRRPCHVESWPARPLRRIFPANNSGITGKGNASISGGEGQSVRTAETQDGRLPAKAPAWGRVSGNHGKSKREHASRLSVLARQDISFTTCPAHE
jgi:hypothetical protein